MLSVDTHLQQACDGMLAGSCLATGISCPHGLMHLLVRHPAVPDACTCISILLKIKSCTAYAGHVRSAWLAGCAANEVTRYLLVEDIPVQGLEEEKKVDAHEEIKSMLAFYSGESFKSNDLILLRNLSCAFMRYMSPEQAERVRKACKSHPFLRCPCHTGPQPCT